MESLGQGATPQNSKAHSLLRLPDAKFGRQAKVADQYPDRGHASAVEEVAGLGLGVPSGGLDHLCEQAVVQYQTGNGYSGKASSISAGRKTKRANIHPTVKPVAVLGWLITLLTPPGGVVCDPFLGSATSAVAAIREGFRFVGCEMTEDYLPIIEGRIRHAEATCVGGESAKGCGH